MFCCSGVLVGSCSSAYPPAGCSAIARFPHRECPRELRFCLNRSLPAFERRPVSLGVEPLVGRSFWCEHPFVRFREPTLHSVGESRNSAPLSTESTKLPLSCDGSRLAGPTPIALLRSVSCDPEDNVQVLVDGQTRHASWLGTLLRNKLFALLE